MCLFVLGWLRYIAFDESVPSDEHRFWVVFSVCEDDKPFLEFYRRRQNTAIVNEGPVSKHSLATCRFVTVVITPKESNEHYEFIIGLNTQNIRLSADNNEVMLDWINVLKNKLIQLNILPASQNSYVQKPNLPPRNPPIQQRPMKNKVYEQIFDSGHNDEEAPPPYEITLSTRLSTISFRETQVE